MERVSEPIDMLERGELAMTTGLNSRVFSIAAEPRFGTIWEGQLYQLDVFGIPMGNPNKERGLDFIRFATGARPLAGQSELLPYGPARRSSLKLVGRNPEMRRYLPTAPENFGRALAVDHDWWAANGARIEARWAEWRQSGTARPTLADVNAARRRIRRALRLGLIDIAAGSTSLGLARSGQRETQASPCFPTRSGACSAQSRPFSSSSRSRFS